MLKKLIKSLVPEELLEHYNDRQRQRRLSDVGHALLRQNQRGLSTDDPGLSASINASLQWLCAAQDRSATQDGGFARHFSAFDGWAPSYPETTGYIIPTLIECGHRYGRSDFLNRAEKALQWCERIQLPSGGFQGGTIVADPAIAVTFNTGQILLGLAAGVRELGNYDHAMRRAADWLVATQDRDGVWRSHPSPYAAKGEKTYETHVAWGLIEAARAASDMRYGEAALANIRWALTKQRPNGWFEDCCLTRPARPLTHTLGYALRGIVEGYLFSGDRTLLGAARKTADGLMTCLREDGFLAGRLNPDWTPAVKWCCLTGNVQIAICWSLLFRITGDERYRGAASQANSFVRRTMALGVGTDVDGGIQGSFPINGAYGRYELLNWASKFFIDSNVLEQQLHEQSG